MRSVRYDIALQIYPFSLYSQRKCKKTLYLRTINMIDMIDNSILRLADIFGQGAAFLDRNGKFLGANAYFRDHYEIDVFSFGAIPLFASALLSSDQKKSLQSTGRYQGDYVLVDRTHELIRQIPDRKMVKNKYIHLDIRRLGLGGIEYVALLDDLSQRYNIDTRLEEMNRYWGFVCELGKEIFFIYDFNTRDFHFLGDTQKIVGTADLNEYLGGLSKSDRSMLLEQWSLSISDGRPRDIFEYTCCATMKGENVYHSIRWVIDHSNPSDLTVYGLVMDITSLSKTESIIGEHLMQLSLLTGDTPIVLWKYEMDARGSKLILDRVSSNEKLVTRLELPDNQVEEDYLRQRISENDWKRLEDEFERQLRGDYSGDELVIGFQISNNNFIFAATKFVIQKTDQNGSPTLLTGFSRLLESSGEVRVPDVPAAGIPSAAKIMTDNRKTILIAEDIDNNFELMDIILRKDYRIVRAVNGIEAVSLFSEIQPDLVFMDMKMPEMGGLEATRLIRMESESIPIIALTAFDLGSDRELALEAGCNAFMSKPVDIPALKNLVKKYLG